MERKGEEERKKGMSVRETWMRKHDLLFMAATNHPFFQSIRDGTLHFSSFNNWLGQEWWLVKNALLPFQSNLLQHNSGDTSDSQVIQQGMNFRKKEEIPWLEQESEKSHISLDDIAPQQAAKDFSKLLENLISSAEVKYPVAVTILWAIESVYRGGFGNCVGVDDDDSETAEVVKEACRKFGGGGFREYCLSLETLVDRTLEKDSDDVVVKAEVVVLQFLEIVVEFWNMNMRTMQQNAA